MQSITRTVAKIKTKGVPTWMIKAGRPAYSMLLGVVYGARGVPWCVNGVQIRVLRGMRSHFPGSHDPGVFDYMRRRVRANESCLNVGANVGIYVLKFAELSKPDGRIVAIEPNAIARSILIKHVNINNIRDRVSVLDVAIGESCGIVDFYRSGEDGMARPLVPHASLANLERVMVKMKTLDVVCEEMRIRPDWVIMDIEGFELEALRGGKALIESGTKLLVEFHPTQWPCRGFNGHTIKQFIENIGYRALSLSNQSDPFAEQGMVALEKA